MVIYDWSSVFVLLIVLLSKKIRKKKSLSKLVLFRQMNFLKPLKKIQKLETAKIIIPVTQIQMGLYFIQMMMKMMMKMQAVKVRRLDKQLFAILNEEIMHAVQFVLLLNQNI